MEVIDHELNRRVSGFRIVSIVIGAISLLNLIRWMLAPTSEMEFVNKAQMIVNLCYFLYSLYLFQISQFYPQEIQIFWKYNLNYF